MINSTSKRKTVIKLIENTHESRLVKKQQCQLLLARHLMTETHKETFNCSSNSYKHQFTLTLNVCDVKSVLTHFTVTFNLIKVSDFVNGNMVCSFSSLKNRLFKIKVYTLLALWCHMIVAHFIDQKVPVMLRKIVLQCYTRPALLSWNWGNMQKDEEEEELEASEMWFVRKIQLLPPDNQRKTKRHEEVLKEGTKQEN